MIRALVNLVVLGAIVALAYYLWNWKFDTGGGGEVAQYAQQACVDEATSRFDPTAARPYSVADRSGGGYVVRVSITTRRGTSARVTCLTSDSGRVENVMVEE